MSGRESNRKDSDGNRTLRETAFLCDAMLGSLVTYCRLCGYDTAYALDRDIEVDDRLLDVAEREKRTLLTRDRQLAARARAAGSGEGSEEGSDERRSGGDSLLLESRDVRGQLRELHASGCELTMAERPTRCGRCNAPLEAVEKERVRRRMHPAPTSRTSGAAPSVGSTSGREATGSRSSERSRNCERRVEPPGPVFSLISAATSGCPVVRTRFRLRSRSSRDRPRAPRRRAPER